MIDATHDPTLQSWVESANRPDSDFPIQNLPYATFAQKGHKHTRLGIVIGEMVLDVGAAFQIPSMEALMALPHSLRLDLRGKASALLSKFSQPPEGFLLPNYKWIPIAYHGRASSVVVSGTPVRRPRGQIVLNPGAPPVYEP